MTGEEIDDLLVRLRKDGGLGAHGAELAMTRLEQLIDLEHPHLAALHACTYETFWDDERKLGILERMQAGGMKHFAILLCHRWTLSELYKTKKLQLYLELFPELPPRTIRGESS